jgi:peptide/nickel transport system substrate-binding protein
LRHRSRFPLRLAAGLLALACTRLIGGPAPFAIAVPSSLLSLDPYEDSVSNSIVVENIYDPLVRLDSDMRIQPALATSWSSPDSLTWTFEIRPGVRFHDGRALRAADVAFSIGHALRDTSGVRYYLLGVDAVEATGPLRVQLHTSRPVPPLLSRLTGIRIVPEGTLEKELIATANGTGAYRLAEWHPGLSARLVRNEAYWGPRPELPEAVIALAQPPAEAARGIGAGEFSLVALGGSELSPAIAADPGITTLEPESNYLKFLAWDLGRRKTPYCPVRPNPFLDPRVREAVDLAIDRESLARALAPGAEPASQLVPRYVFGFDPELPVSRPDAARARRLLASAGLRSGFGVTLHTRPLFAAAAARVGDQLAAVGVRVTLQTVPESEFMAQFPRPDYTLWIDRWGCATGDVSELFENAMHSRDAGRGLGLFNDTGHADRLLDREIEATFRLDMNAERQIALQKIMRRVVAVRYWLPLYTDREHYALDRAWAWRPRHDLGIRVSEIQRR